MGDSGGFRKIRILNGAIAILKILQNQPFCCVFVGDMPILLNGGKVPSFLELTLIPKPGCQTVPNIPYLLCQYQSTQFRFDCTGPNQLRYVDLTGGIPPGKKNWCEVRTTFIRAPPQFGLDKVVEINGIPAVHIFVLFIDTLKDLLDRYDDSLRTGSGMSQLTKNKLRTIIQASLMNAAVPQDLDQARTALSASKRLTDILSRLPQISKKVRQLSDYLQKITGTVEDWVKAHQASVDDERRFSPVTQDVDKEPEPVSAAREDRDETDDWVEVTMSAGVIEMHEERVDEAFDFEFVSMD